MDKALKQRMVGAAVLVSLGVIVLPVIFDREGTKTAYPDIPAPPPRPLVAEPIEIDTSEIVLSQAAKAPADTAQTFTPQKVDGGVDTNDLSAWVVQLDSFAKKNNAVELTQNLQDDGFNAFIEPVQRDSATLHRVRIGPVMTLDRANAIREQLKAKHQRNSVVMRYYGSRIDP